MRKWINLFESVSEESLSDWLVHADTTTTVLPKGTMLWHGTSRDWNPEENHLQGPAWFGNQDLARFYMQNHEDAVLLRYETTEDLTLLVLDGETGRRFADLIGDTATIDLAYHALDKFDGWLEPDNGEVMIGDTDSVRFIKTELTESATTEQWEFLHRTLNT